MMRLILCGLSLLLGASAALAQTAEVPPETPAAAPPPCIIPLGTPIMIEVLDSILSKKAKSGQNFAIGVASPVVIGEWTALPAGLTGVGEVVHAKKAMFIGSAGELIVAARYVMFGEIRIPLRSLNLSAAGGSSSTLYVGSGTAMMLDHNYNTEIPAGTVAQAKIAADVTIPCPAPEPAPVTG